MILQAYSKYFVATSQVLPPIIVTLLSISALYVLFFSTLFNITKVECYQDVGEVCQNSFVTTEASSALGQNLFRFDDAAAGDIIRRGDPTIRSLEYQKVLPGTLILQIQSVYPTLALGTEGSTNLLILDADFRIIKSSDVNPNVPVARYYKSLSHRVGERLADETLRKELSACLKIISSLPGSSNCSLTKDALKLTLDDSQTTAIFTSERDLDQQLSALHTILTGVTISGSGVVIDVRYQQPIIKGNN